MPDITALVPGKTSVPTPQQLPARGVIVTAPALTDATVEVVVPSHSTTYSLSLRWIRQGAALPAAGADCKVVFDETGEGVVIWWAGGDQQPAQARVSNSTTQTLTTATVTLLTFDSERFDTSGSHSTAANTERLIATMDGLYLLGAKLDWDVGGTGRREAFINYSSGGEIARDGRDATSSGVSFITISGLWRATAGGYFTVSGYHERGTNLAVTAEFWMTRLSH